MMTEIEQLKNDLATLEAAKKVDITPATHYSLNEEINYIEKRIAELETQQKKVDEWEQAKYMISAWSDMSLGKKYVRHLEAKVVELETEITDLKAKAKREQLDLCEECGYPLSCCWSSSVDGTPIIDCKACQLRAKIAELEVQTTAKIWVLTKGDYYNRYSHYYVKSFKNKPSRESLLKLLTSHGVIDIPEYLLNVLLYSGDMIMFDNVWFCLREVELKDN